jgi:hypothetical protein
MCRVGCWSLTQFLWSWTWPSRIRMGLGHLVLILSQNLAQSQRPIICKFLILDWPRWTVTMGALHQKYEDLLIGSMACSVDLAGFIIHAHRANWILVGALICVCPTFLHKCVLANLSELTIWLKVYLIDFLFYQYNQASLYHLPFTLIPLLVSEPYLVSD